MDKTLQDLIRLAEDGTTEIRCASLLMLGALKSPDEKVVKMAGSILNQKNSLLRGYALRYFEECRPKAGIPFLLLLLGDEEKEIRDQAIRVLSDFGRAVLVPLLKNSKKRSVLFQLGAVQVLFNLGGRAAWKGIFEILKAGDLEINKTASDLGIAVLRKLEDKRKGSLYGEIQEFAKSLDEKTQRPVLISAIRFIGQIGQPKMRGWLINMVSIEHHHTIRFFVLVALLRCLHNEELSADEIGKLLPILEEQEFPNIIRLTLDLLDSHTLTENNRSQLSQLMKSQNPLVQKFALRKLGEFHTPGVARTLIEQLGDRDYARRDAAARSLRNMPEARTALVKEFLTCEDASKAWTISELLILYKGKWKRAVLESIWKRLRLAVDEADRIQRSYLHFLKNIDQEYTYAQLESAGGRLKKAKKYKEAIRFLSLLQELSIIKVEDKFALAISHLRLHSQTSHFVGKQQSPALELLMDLYRNSTFPLFEALKKEKSLSPENLFYLGFNFSEGLAEDQALGNILLELIIQRYPRTKISRNAKNKLMLLAG